MRTNCTPLVANLFLFCYERDFMLSLSDNDQADFVEEFNSTSIQDMFHVYLNKCEFHFSRLHVNKIITFASS